MAVKEFTKNILLCLLSIFIFFGFAELLCRLKYNPTKHAYNGIFEYDKDKVYRLKKNIKNGNYAGKLCETNLFGYRDREIPAKKNNNTFRILVVGDSVTFGDGVLCEETYPNRLEWLLNQNLNKYHFDVINTAVPGNSPFQEYYDLKRGLVFEPDIVIIQFVLNDLVEPYKVFRRYGGKGIDYHNVSDIPYWHYFLSERSAFYLFLYDLFAKVKFSTMRKDVLKDKAMRREIELSWTAAADEPANEKAREAWEECFKWMQRAVDICKRRDIACILLISPVRFQFLDDSRTYAQKALKKFASKNGIECIDLLPLLRGEARRQIISAYSLKGETQFNELAATQGKDIKGFWSRYFLDYDHYTSDGHALVADILYPVVCELVKKRGLKI